MSTPQHRTLTPANISHLGAALALTAVALTLAINDLWVPGTITVIVIATLLVNVTTDIRTRTASLLASVPGPPAGGPGLRPEEAQLLHRRYVDAIATEQQRQSEDGISPSNPESADCLAAAILADRDPVLIEALTWARNTEIHVNRLTTQLDRTRSVIRQASDLTTVWRDNAGQDAPGLTRAAGELDTVLTGHR